MFVFSFDLVSMFQKEHARTGRLSGEFSDQTLSKL